MNASTDRQSPPTKSTRLLRSDWDWDSCLCLVCPHARHRPQINGIKSTDPPSSSRRLFQRTHSRMEPRTTFIPPTYAPWQNMKPNQTKQAPHRTASIASDRQQRLLLSLMHQHSAAYPGSNESLYRVPRPDQLTRTGKLHPPGLYYESMIWQQQDACKASEWRKEHHPSDSNPSHRPNKCRIENKGKQAKQMEHLSSTNPTIFCCAYYYLDLGLINMPSPMCSCVDNASIPWHAFTDIFCSRGSQIGRSTIPHTRNLHYSTGQNSFIPKRNKNKTPCSNRN